MHSFPPNQQKVVLRSPCAHMAACLLKSSGQTWSDRLTAVPAAFCGSNVIAGDFVAVTPVLGLELWTKTGMSIMPTVPNSRLLQDRFPCQVIPNQIAVTNPVVLWMGRSRFFCGHFPSPNRYHPVVSLLQYPVLRFYVPLRTWVCASWLILFPSSPVQVPGWTYSLGTSYFPSLGNRYRLIWHTRKNPWTDNRQIISKIWGAEGPQTGFKSHFMDTFLFDQGLQVVGKNT